LTDSEADEATFPDKEVGDGGKFGRIYLPKECIGRNAKLIIPAGFGNENEIIFKNVGDGNTQGVLYVHKKHIGKMITVVIIPRMRKKRGGG
jgi:putative transposon-encoded protein